MNKNELIGVVARRTGHRKRDVQEIINCFLDSITDGLLEDGRVQILGFGTFYKAVRGEKVGRSMKNGEPLRIPPATVVRFKPGSELKRGMAECDMDTRDIECRSVFLP